MAGPAATLEPMSDIKIIAALIALISLLGAGAWGYRAIYDKGHAAGMAQVQVAWDADKAAIAKLAADQLAKVSEERDQALANNEAITNDLNAQIQTERNLNSSLASRLRHYQTAAGSSAVPESGDQPAAADTPESQSLGRLNDALAAALTECAVNRDNYNALIKELTPQL